MLLIHKTHRSNLIFKSDLHPAHYFDLEEGPVVHLPQGIQVLGYIDARLLDHFLLNFVDRVDKILLGVLEITLHLRKICLRGYEMVINKFGCLFNSVNQNTIRIGESTLQIGL